VPEITLFPMLHVGEASFYDDVKARRLEMDLVLIEGVPSSKVRALTRVYRWLPLRRLGLIVQPRFGPLLERAGVPVQTADMRAPDFDAAWASLPRLMRFGLPVVTTAVAIWLRLTATRAALAKRMNTTDLPGRAHILNAGSALDPLDTLISDQRDAILVAALHAALDTNAGRPVKIGVVYGAAHMAAIVHALPDYWPYDSEWMTVFRL
ncbi:MAG: hypothetical protein AAFN59_07790, partial [Pseudomonadota bacterium]